MDDWPEVVVLEKEAPKYGSVADIVKPLLTDDEAVWSRLEVLVWLVKSHVDQPRVTVLASEHGEPP